MPKQVDEIVEALLSDPDFYPEKSEKQQKAIAFDIAWSQHNKKHKRKKESPSRFFIKSNHKVFNIL